MGPSRTSVSHRLRPAFRGEQQSQLQQLRHEDHRGSGYCKRPPGTDPTATLRQQRVLAVCPPESRQNKQLPKSDARSGIGGTITRITDPEVHRLHPQQHPRRAYPRPGSRLPRDATARRHTAGPRHHAHGKLAASQRLRSRLPTDPYGAVLQRFRIGQRRHSGHSNSRLLGSRPPAAGSRPRGGTQPPLSPPGSHHPPAPRPLRGHRRRSGCSRGHQKEHVQRLLLQYPPCRRPQATSPRTTPSPPTSSFPCVGK